jgi:hypothetical protein
MISGAQISRCPPDCRAGRRLIRWPHDLQPLCTRRDRAPRRGARGLRRARRRPAHGRDAEAASDLPAAAAANDWAKRPPLALGTSARFAPIAGVGPHAAFSVTVLRVVVDGHARNGSLGGVSPLADDFGTVVKSTKVRFRYVNVKVRLRNHGPASFRGSVEGSVIGTGGGTWPELPHAGRRPDWSDGEEHGIAPGHSVTRWLTVAVPASRRPALVELRPEALSGPSTVVSVDPEGARWRAR